MRILGIDPGLQVCGYACIETGPDGEALVEAGVIRTDTGSAIEQKLNRIAEDTQMLLSLLIALVAGSHCILVMASQNMPDNVSTFGMGLKAALADVEIVELHEG